MFEGTNELAPWKKKTEVSNKASLLNDPDALKKRLTAEVRAGDW